MSNWTPGPWSASLTYPPVDYVIHARGIPWQLAYLAVHTEIDWPLEANARLIAAAPELYEALWNMVTLARPFMSDEPQMLGLRLAQEALAKARGETLLEAVE